MNTDKIIQDIAYLAVTLAPLVGAWFAAILHKRYTADQMDRALHFAHTAVDAAEQIANACPTAIGGHGKYQLAEDMVLRLTDKAGIHLTEAQVQPLIEAAVYSAKQFGHALAPVAVASLEPIPGAVAITPPPGIDAGAVAAIVEDVLQKHFAPKPSLLGEATN